MDIQFKIPIKKLSSLENENNDRSHLLSNNHTI